LSREALLITGINGFVGRGLAAALQESDCLVKGTEKGDRKAEKGEGKRKNGSQVFVTGEIDERTDWSEALDGIDVVVHLAARVHVMDDSAADPLAEFRKVNTAGTLNLARQAAVAGVKRFIFISSIKVNGEETGRPETGDRRTGNKGKDGFTQRRKDAKVRGKGNEESSFFSESDVACPQDAYAVSKWEAEQGLMAIAEKTGMEVVIIRPPLVYGPGVKANFRLLMKWVKRGVPLPLGAVHNKRSFVALDNLVSFIICCMDHPRAANEVFLISDEEDVSTTELLQKMARAFGKRSFLLPVPVGLMTFVAGPLGKKDVADRLFGSLQVDSSKARDLLGWTPVVTMDEGLMASR
jgi:nucleoside-diphosphate-sugar epimerase